MAAYNPRNFDLGQFMNDLFQQPDLGAQLQFLGSHLQVINSYAAGLEIELTRVTAIATTAQAQAQAQPGTLGAAPTSGTSKKVEVFADPGNFSGEINHFEEWWLKMKTWLNINQQTIPARSYDAVVLVLSRMKQKAGTFSAQRLEKGIAYTWAELETDIVKQYRPTARPDWARRKLWSLKQGNTRSCNYVDLFTKYFRDAEIGHSHAIDILEQNMNAEIRDQIVLKKVLKRLEEHDLFAKPEKCTFGVKEVEFLGMIVSREGIKMDDSKVKAIREWPTPKTVRGVRSFLGLANFYRRFIEGYAQVARPLNDLTKKDTPFAWKEAQQTAFDTLKNRFTTAPILAYPDNDRVFHLETDASNFATGAVLSIEQNGKWHPVAFSSHSMSPEERNYLVADKEMLSVIRSLEQWRHYLEGAHHEFEIWNDHANLQWFMKHQDLNRRQARWAQYLSRFNFKWLHKAGATMGKADALSRREDHSIGIEKDNTGILVIPPDRIRSVTEVRIATDADIIIDTIKDILYDLKEPDLIPLRKQYIEGSHLL
jgi:hypothetical protein